MENTVYSFGEYVRKLRTDAHLPLTTAAKRMGISPQKLSDIESGRRYHTRVSIELVQRVASAFEVRISDVIKSIRTTASVKQSTAEALLELSPLVKYAVTASHRLALSLSTYPKELEDLAIELSSCVQNIEMLVTIIKDRQVTIIQKE